MDDVFLFIRVLAIPKSVEIRAVHYPNWYKFGQ
jgi:hypothetical protein